MLAASKGLSVEAMTDVMESMTRMASRFHKGQFCLLSALAYVLQLVDKYEGIIWVVAWLRHQYRRYWATSVVFQSRSAFLDGKGPAAIVVDMRSSYDDNQRMIEPS